MLVKVKPDTVSLSLPVLMAIFQVNLV